MKVQIVMMEMFTSISAMEEIVHSERMLIENLENYIGLERSRIDILEGWIVCCFVKKNWNVWNDFGQAAKWKNKKRNMKSNMTLMPVSFIVNSWKFSFLRSALVFKSIADPLKSEK
jgi:hypothetical protein